jgi:hypothetical protein
MALVKNLTVANPLLLLLLLVLTLFATVLTSDGGHQGQLHGFGEEPDGSQSAVIAAAIRMLLVNCWSLHHCLQLAVVGRLSSIR